MKRRKYNSKEEDQLQHLKWENKKLREAVSKLRKQLARIDLDRYSYVKEIVDEHLAEQTEEITTTQMLSSMKNEWQCHECGVGHLEIVLYGGPGGTTHYYRNCNNCTNRTKGQKYDPDTVRGILKNVQEKAK